MAYMSPEQLLACDPKNQEYSPESLDEQSDVYSLGVVLWELLFGRRPFKDPKMLQDWSATLNSCVEARRDDPCIDQWIPKELANSPLVETLRKCIAFDPDERFKNADQLHSEMRLSLNPKAKKILRPSKAGIIGWMQKHPLLAAVLILLLFLLVDGFQYQ